MNQWGKEHTPFVFLIDFECKKPMCWKWSDTENIFEFNFDGVTNQKKANIQNNDIPISNFEFNKVPISFEDYKNKFDQVKKEIEIGNSFLVNLTAKTKINSNYTIAEIYNQANAKYTCYLKDSFVCFSPETFIQINNGKIRSFPMKGTIDANIPNAKELILADPKEIAEHATIVDLIRNDLSRVCTEVHVKHYRQVHYYSHVIHLVSEVEGKVAKDANPFHLIAKTFPAGTLSGAPKFKAMQLIDGIEPTKRSYYGGCIGFVGFNGSCNQAIMIRTFLSQQNTLTYQAGAGVVAASHPESELQEVNNKLNALKTAIVLAEKI